MIDTSSGRIFLAGQRGHTETTSFRSCRTSFGGQYELQDITLASGESMQLQVAENTTIALLPTVGAIHIEKEGLLEAGQVQLLKGAATVISNPYEHELVNYLQLSFKNATAENELYSFDISKGQLTDLFAASMEGGLLFASIGKFSGREEVVYETYQQGNGVFVFVIQGAFEVQYRLLETRDGLALWDVEQIEIEALSNDAILLLVELPGVYQF